MFNKREKLQQKNTKAEKGVISADHMENFQHEENINNIMLIQ